MCWLQRHLVFGEQSFEIGHDWRRDDGPIHHHQKRRSNRQNKARVSRDGGGAVTWGKSIMGYICCNASVSRNNRVFCECHSLSQTPPPHINHRADRSCKSPEPVHCHFQASPIYQPGSAPVPPTALPRVRQTCHTIYAQFQLQRHRPAAQTRATTQCLST
jgi:hypothetical protein